MSELNKTYEIRDYNPTTDKSFIMATWLRGLYYGNKFYGMMRKEDFMFNYKNFLEVLLTKSSVRIACLIEDKDTILGYGVFSPNQETIHWIFVKSIFRKQGIGKSLLPKYPSYISHFTDLGLELSKKFPDCVFNPFSF